MNTPNNPFIIGSGLSKALPYEPARSAIAAQKDSSFLSELTNLMSKALGAGAGIATSAALPGISGLGLGVASDKLVQSLVKNLSSDSSKGAVNSIQIAKNNQFLAPRMPESQHLGFLQSTSSYLSQSNLQASTPSMVSFKA